jgi:hypothetical protein
MTVVWRSVCCNCDNWLWSFGEILIKTKEKQTHLMCSFCLGVAHFSDVQTCFFFLPEISLLSWKSVFQIFTDKLAQWVTMLRVFEDLKKRWVKLRPRQASRFISGWGNVQLRITLSRRTFTLSSAIQAVLLASFLLADTQIFIPVK